MSRVGAVAICVAVVAAVYLLMWAGWRRRGRKHDLPPLPALPAAGSDEALLEADTRYYGSTVAGSWLDRVVARGLGTRSPAHLRLTAAGLDVDRPGGAFRIPAAALRGARHDQGVAGKVVPPHGVVVVTWHHGDLDLDSGFRLVEGAGTEAHDAWVTAIDRIVSTQEGAA